jgi:hypothetical protein
MAPKEMRLRIGAFSVILLMFLRGVLAEYVNTFFIDIFGVRISRD